MKEYKLKKKEWEDYLKHWSKLRHPIIPEKISLATYKKLIKKYVKGNKVLLLGATCQLRDLLAKLNMHVTCVDISPIILKAHEKMCKVRKRKEKIVVGDWLKYNPKERFDLVIADAANFQIKESSYDLFFSKVASWLKKTGVSIQLIVADYKKTRVELKDVVDYIKKSKKLEDYRMKGYYYLGYSHTKNKGKFKNIAALEYDVQPYIDKGIITKKRFNKFSLHLKKFSAQLVEREKMEKYIKKHLKILEKIPHGDTFVEEAFYWQYVMKRK